MSQFSVSSEMVARYVLNREKEVQFLKDALVSKDFSFIASKAHNLKGTAESFGFPELGLVGQDLEAVALAQEENAIVVQIKNIESWVAKHLGK